MILLCVERIGFGTGDRAKRGVMGRLIGVQRNRMRKNRMIHLRKILWTHTRGIAPNLPTPSFALLSHL